MTSTLLLRINGVVLLLILGALVVIIAMSAARARGGPLDPPAAPGSTDGVKLTGTPISSVPYVISSPGRYYLTRDLAYGGNANAIEIAGFVKYVTLDLNGFTLSGLDTGTGIRAIGPSPPAQFPLRVMNGYVRDFSIGVHVATAAHARVENIHVYSNTIAGIVIGNHSVVDGCTSALNTEEGIVMAGALAVVRNCMVVDNGTAGVEILDGGNLLEDSEILRNNPGIAVTNDGSVIRRNIVHFEVSPYSIERSSGKHIFSDNVYCSINDVGTSVFVGNTQLCP